MLSSESGEKVELEDNIKKELHFKPIKGCWGRKKGGG